MNGVAKADAPTNVKHVAVRTARVAAHTFKFSPRSRLELAVRPTAFVRFIFYAHVVAL